MFINKTVLLRERKRHTARAAQLSGSCPVGGGFPCPDWSEGGTPVLAGGWGGRVPLPWLGCVCVCVWGWGGGPADLVCGTTHPLPSGQTENITFPILWTRALIILMPNWDLIISITTELNATSSLHYVSA